MAKLKDGFYKQTASSIGSDLLVLLAGGGSKPISDFALASSLSDYVTLGTAQTITGSKTFNTDVAFNNKLFFGGIDSTDQITIYGEKNATTATISYLVFQANDDASDGFIFRSKIYGTDTPYDVLKITQQAIRATSNITAPKFITSGGTSSQFVKGDGSLDGTSYATSASLNNYVTLTTAQTISGVKTFSTQQKFTVAQGTSPFTVASTTVVTNLHSQFSDDLTSTGISDPASAYSTRTHVKWFTGGSTNTGSSGYMGTSAGFPVSNNANGILWMGTHSGPYGGQLGISSNGSLYYRFIVNNTFPTTANGGSWNRIAWSSEVDALKDYYWANVKISKDSSTTTSPTFGNTNINGILNINSGSTREALTIDSTNQAGAIVKICQNGTAKMWYGYSPVLGGVYYFNENDTGIFLKDNNNVGIGTTSPSRKLHVAGVTQTDGLINTNHYTWTSGFNFVCIPTSNGNEWSFDLGRSSYDSTTVSSYTGTYLQVWSSKHAASIISFHNDTRYVGINTITPSCTLDVVGKTKITYSGTDAELLTLSATNSSYNCISYSKVGTGYNWSVGTSSTGFYFWNSNKSNEVVLISNDGSLIVHNSPIWIQGGSDAGGNSNRLTTTTGMPGNMQYNVGRRGTQIYSNGIAFADPYNGNTNNDSGWIRHIETTANKSILEIATGDDGDSSEEIRFRSYNTSNTINYDILVPKASGTLALVGQSYTKSEADSRFLLRQRMTNPSNGTSYHGAIPYALALKSAGTPIYGDPEFASGINNCLVYNNSGNSTVAVSRITDNQGSANSSGYILQIVNNGGTSSPGRGGFYQNINARQNAVFAQIFRAKIPTGFSVANAENTMGNGYTTYWLTDTAGTGKWAWYIRITICGNGGSYSNGGHVYLNGSGAVTWYLSYCNVIDLTRGSQDGLRSQYSRYVIGDNNAASPGYALLQSGGGRADASPGGDTWIYWDTLGGTTSPWGILHEQASNYISFYGAGNRRTYINLTDGCVYGAHFYENSDIKLKKNIKNISSSDNMPIIKEYDWKEDGTHSYGLIAQELEEMGYPELVSGDDNGGRTVNYSAALSLIVGKLQVKIKELEKEIEILKNKN